MFVAAGAALLFVRLPATVTVAAMETGCVACQKVPETGWVTADPSTFRAPAALMLATLVPPVSTSFVFWLPPVRVASRAREPLVPMLAVTVPETAKVPVPAF